LRGQRKNTFPKKKKAGTSKKKKGFRQLCKHTFTGGMRAAKKKTDNFCGKFCKKGKNKQGTCHKGGVGTEKPGQRGGKRRRTPHHRPYSWRGMSHGKKKNDSLTTRKCKLPTTPKKNGPNNREERNKGSPWLPGYRQTTTGVDKTR